MTKQIISSNLVKKQQVAPSEPQQTIRSQSLASKIRQYVIVGTFLLGVIVSVISLLCILWLPTFVSSRISEKLVLKNNSLLLERWSKPNVPMFFKVWIFDVSNAQEIIDRRGTRPKLKEIGPFVFNLKRKKDIVSFAGENLYYTERKIYHFNQELSCCAINTTVTIPNVPLVAVVDRALSYNLPLVGRFIPRLINRAIQSLREQLFVKKQVREILFDGYEVELLKMVSRVGSIVGLPQTQQKFALLKGRNDTWRPEQDGVWAINTGSRDRRLFGRVSSWNSYRQLPFWAAPGCNTINGSDGTLFPPPIKRTEPLYIFNQELCRTVNLVFERPSEIRSIKAYRFALNPLNFAHTMSPVTRPARPFGSDLGGAAGPSAKMEPIKPAASERQTLVARKPVESSSSLLANKRQWMSGTRESGTQRAVRDPSKPATQAEQQRLVQVAQEQQAQVDRSSEAKQNPLTCFCDRKSTNLNGVNVCEFDGLIELSKCTKQAQVIFGSMPHFHQSDPRLLNQVTGMEPNASKHTTYLDIEPNTGLVLGGKRRVQLNILIKHNNEVDGFENINDMLIPLVWFEESAMIPEESAQKFKSLYTNPIFWVNFTLRSLFLAAVCLTLINAPLLIAHYAHCYQRFKLDNCKSSSKAPRNQELANDKTGEFQEDSQSRNKGLTFSTSARKKRTATNHGGSNSPLLFAGNNYDLSDNTLVVNKKQFFAHNKDTLNGDEYGTGKHISTTRQENRKQAQ